MRPNCPFRPMSSMRTFLRHSGYHLQIPEVATESESLAKGQIDAHSAQGRMHALLQLHHAMVA